MKRVFNYKGTDLIKLSDYINENNELIMIAIDITYINTDELEEQGVYVYHISYEDIYLEAEKEERRKKRKYKEFKKYFDFGLTRNKI